MRQLPRSGKRLVGTRKWEDKRIEPTTPKDTGIQEAHVDEVA